MRRQIIIGPDTKIAQVGGRPPRMVLILLVEQISLFLLWAFANDPAWIRQHLAASASRCLGQGELWQPLTALWFHVGSRSLLLNMLSLWIFGSALERWWGPRRFLLFWMITGVAGLVGGVLLGQLQPTYVMAGSAGSAVGMLLSFGLIFPSHHVFLYGVLPLKAKPLALVFIGFILLGSLVDGAYLELGIQLVGGLTALLFLLRPAVPTRPTPRAPRRETPSHLKILDGGKKKDTEHYWN
jgi:membrane associated rhomboid family serine protease